MIKDEVVGWYHQLEGYEFEQALGVGDGQGSLACCNPWDCKESDTTEQLHSFTHSPTHSLQEGAQRDWLPQGDWLQKQGRYVLPQCLFPQFSSV